MRYRRRPARRADRRDARALYRLPDSGRLRDRDRRRDRARPGASRKGRSANGWATTPTTRSAASLCQREDRSSTATIRSSPARRSTSRSTRPACSRASPARRRSGARSTPAACPRCWACGTTRPAPRRASPRSRSASAIPAMRARRCTSPRPARAAPMPASGPWWSTRTSTPASSTRCCGRCARASIRSPTSTSIQKAWASKRDPLFLPGNFNNRILVDACIPYDKKLKGTFPVTVDVSADLRARAAGEIPAAVSHRH